MTLRVTSLISLMSVAVLALLAGDDLVAQVPYSTACQTNVGICAINPLPLNSACRCFNDPGRVIQPPGNWSNICRIPPQGAGCQSWSLPVGSPCACGNMQGQIAPK